MELECCGHCTQTVHCTLGLMHWAGGWRGILRVHKFFFVHCGLWTVDCGILAPGWREESMNICNLKKKLR